jgi:predicted ribosomally synthesized peptide with SipW-like signal peptide
MIERKFIPLVVAVFVLTAGLSGSATLAVLSDSETVNVQISPDNVTASVVDDNASAPAEENETSLNTTTVEVPTVEEAGGLVVFLDPIEGQTVAANETAQYDVVVKGATEGIQSYALTLELSNSSVASFENFDYGNSIGNHTITGDRIDVSAGYSDAIPNMSEDTPITLGTVTVAGDMVGTTNIEPINETGHRLNVPKNTTGTYYNISAKDGSDLTVTAANESSNSTGGT